MVHLTGARSGMKRSPRTSTSLEAIGEEVWMSHGSVVLEYKRRKERQTFREQTSVDPTVACCTSFRGIDCLLRRLSNVIDYWWSLVRNCGLPVNTKRSRSAQEKGSRREKDFSEERSIPRLCLKFDVTSKIFQLSSDTT